VASQEAFGSTEFDDVLTFSSGNSASHLAPALLLLRRCNGEAVLFNKIISVESPIKLAQVLTLRTCIW
jgi:hypothetical protein